MRIRGYALILWVCTTLGCIVVPIGAGGEATRVVGTTSAPKRTTSMALMVHPMYNMPIPISNTTRSTTSRRTKQRPGVVDEDSSSSWSYYQSYWDALWPVFSFVFFYTSTLFLTSFSSSHEDFEDSDKLHSTDEGSIARTATSGDDEDEYNHDHHENNEDELFDLELLQDEMGCTDDEMKKWLSWIDTATYKILSPERKRDGIPEYLTSSHERMYRRLTRVLLSTIPYGGEFLIRPLLHGIIHGRHYINTKVASPQIPNIYYSLLLWICQYRLLRRAIHWRGGDDMVAILLNVPGINVNIVAPDGSSTAAYFAVKGYASPKTLQLLINRGIKLDHHNHNRNNKSNNVKITTTNSETDDDDDFDLHADSYDLLYHALENPNPTVIRTLLKNGYTANKVYLDRHHDWNKLLVVHTDQDDECSHVNDDDDNANTFYSNEDYRSDYQYDKDLTDDLASFVSASQIHEKRQQHKPPKTLITALDYLVSLFHPQLRRQYHHHGTETIVPTSWRNLDIVPSLDHVVETMILLAQHGAKFHSFRRWDCCIGWEKTYRTSTGSIVSCTSSILSQSDHEDDAHHHHEQQEQHLDRIYRKLIRCAFGFWLPPNVAKQVQMIDGQCAHDTSTNDTANAVRFDVPYNSCPVCHVPLIASEESGSSNVGDSVDTNGNVQPVDDGQDELASPSLHQEESNTDAEQKLRLQQQQQVRLYCGHTYCSASCIILHGKRGTKKACLVCQQPLCLDVAPRSTLRRTASLERLLGLKESNDGAGTSGLGILSLSDDQVYAEAQAQGLLALETSTDNGKNGQPSLVKADIESLRSKLLTTVARGHQVCSSPMKEPLVLSDGAVIDNLREAPIIDVAAVNSYYVNKNEDSYRVAPFLGPVMIEIKVKGIPIVASLSNNSYYTCVSSTVVDTLKLKRIDNLCTDELRDTVTGKDLNGMTFTCLDQFGLTIGDSDVEVILRNAVEVSPDLENGVGIQLGLDFFLSSKFAVMDVLIAEPSTFMRFDGWYSWIFRSQQDRESVSITGSGHTHGESLRFYSHDGKSVKVNLLHFKSPNDNQIQTIAVKQDSTFKECSWCCRAFPRGMILCPGCKHARLQDAYYCNERCQSAALSIHRIQRKVAHQDDL